MERSIAFLRRASLAAACLLLLIAVSTAMSRPADAQTVLGSSDSFGPVPGFAGTGLSGTYTAFTVSQDPIATFTTSNICYPDCLGSVFDDSNGGLLAFTNGNIDNVNFSIPSEQIPNDWSSSGLSIAGYLAITQPGTYNFSLGSDDSSHLQIAGQDILDINDCCTTVGGQVTFTASGLYAIAVQFMEFGGGSYLNLTAFDSNETCFLGCTDQSGALTNSGLFYSDGQLQSAPAPLPGSGIASLTVVFAGFAFAARRKDRRAATNAA
jgi:hypothetical protein